MIRRALYALRAVGAVLSWVMQPPDFAACRWANETHGEDL